MSAAPGPIQSATAPARTGDRLAAESLQATATACRYLLNRQRPQGYWVGEIEGDSTLLSDYVLLQLWLHPPSPAGCWDPPSSRRVAAARHEIRRQQLRDGGWSIYSGGPANLSASVKAYCALKVAGDSDSSARMRTAARRIVSLGGVEAANSYTKLYLSYFGLYPRSKTPSIPPEIFLIRPQSRFSVYAMSSWSRAMLAPLSILDATRARRAAPRGMSLVELFAGTDPPAPEADGWKRLFLWLDRCVKLLESTGLAPDRKRGIAAARDWMLARLHRSDGLGAIFPAMVNSIMALTQLGYGLDHPLLRRELRRFDGLCLDDEAGFRLQPCRSPVWDTALTAYAIGSAGRDPDQTSRWALSRAADWLLAKEVRHKGDWAVRNPDVGPGGWYFEFANEFYPDTDDTAKVLLALEHASSTDPDRQRAAERRALRWLVSMQSSDGGWAAFDRDNCLALLTHVPFADHNAMLDPTCPDITGRVLEAICRRAPGRHERSVRRAVRYLLGCQAEDGFWRGRWGVNRLYGTYLAARGLRAAGLGPDDAALVRAGEWVRSVQNPDGGWGESPSSYEEHEPLGRAASAPSQTAWALLALFAAGDFGSRPAREGVRYLLDNQTPRGSWTEEAFTGCGFPRVFYLRYHMYPRYFPLIALSEFVRARRRTAA